MTKTSGTRGFLHTHTHTHTHTSKSLLSIGAVALTLLINLPIFAQTSDNASGTASAGILVPISVTHNSDVHFGTFTPNLGAAIIAFFGPSGNYGHVTNNAWLRGQQAGRFTINGQPGQKAIIEYFAPTGEMTHETDNEYYMVLDFSLAPVFTPGFNSAQVQETITLPESGSLQKYVPIRAWASHDEMLPGAYSGVYTITVSYEAGPNIDIGGPIDPVVVDNP